MLNIALIVWDYIWITLFEIHESIGRVPICCSAVIWWWVHRSSVARGGWLVVTRN